MKKKLLEWFIKNIINEVFEHKNIIDYAKTVIKSNDRVVMLKHPLDQTKINANGLRTEAKPKSAFWYGCGAEWIEFVEDSGMTDFIGPYIYLLDLDINNMKVIQTEQELIEFEQEYGISSTHGIIAIDWVKVSKQYSGIEICPYIWQRREDSRWYYPWDVASGAIWNGSVIKGFKRLLPKYQ